VFCRPAKGLEVGAGAAVGIDDTDGYLILARLSYEFD
jgi:hypothetical protein